MVCGGGVCWVCVVVVVLWWLTMVVCGGGVLWWFTMVECGGEAWCCMVVVRGEVAWKWWQLVVYGGMVYQTCHRSAVWWCCIAIL